jgi:NADH-quinone oxidoreductase subunit C
MANIETLVAQVKERFADILQDVKIAVGELTIEVSPKHLREVCLALRDDTAFKFEMLIDICGVDYLDYGLSEWVTDKATGSGFERGVNTNNKQRVIPWDKPRFAVVYHLLSLQHNHRVRIRTFADGEPPMIDSIIDIWKAADWYEREAFDLYGILFNGHPDLRRILTDYGFIGHPFRKDFPLSGNVEMRYDATEQRVVYMPVDIEPRVLEPKVIRKGGYYDDIKPPVVEEGNNNA